MPVTRTPNNSATPRRASRPRNAASLVIHRARGSYHEVLMGRRGSRARFKPGVYVFPGGVVERSDHRARPLASLPADVPPQLAVAASAGRADALAMAAVREAFEEAGLLYGHAGDIGTVRHGTWEQFRERGVAPDLSALDYLGRAITPSQQRLRFHARFFAVPFDACSGEIGGDGELEDLRWVRTDQLHGIDMMLVQKLVIDTLHRRLNGENATARRMIFNRGRNAPD